MDEVSVFRSMSYFAGRSLAWTALCTVPIGESLVFGSDHSSDPDALVILDYLSHHSSRELRWTAPNLPAANLLGSLAQHRVAIDRERTLASFVQYSRARTIFHTAGLYGSPQPPTRRDVVTVWHGDGPKVSTPPRVRGTYMVTGVKHFGMLHTSVHGYPESHLLTTGRPRVDDLFHGLQNPMKSELLIRLGLDDRPIVWWLPTWRQNKKGSPLGMEHAIPAFMESAARSAPEFQFVIKPHRLTPAFECPSGWKVVTDSALQQGGVRLYRLLGSAHALLTDYSSVWSDFLGTRVPIGFVISDLEQFSKSRGLFENDWLENLPGPVIQNADSLVDFVGQGWNESMAAHRRELALKLGANNQEGATARLFASLDDHGVVWK